MKKILVPTDLSDVAELGLQLAVEIAKRASATVSLVNFKRHPFGPTFSVTGDVTVVVDEEEERYTLELLKTTKAKLEELALKFGSYNVPIEIAVVDNTFKDGVDEYLKAENIDLIVMGTSGEETAREVFTGNHTEQAIKISSCPVLSVRDGFNVEDFKNIVVGVNIITDNQVAEGLNTLQNLAEYFDSQIHLVHVRDNTSTTNILLDEYFTQMANIANLKNFVVRILDAEDPAEGLINYSNEIRAGLVAVLKNSKDGIFRLFSNHFSNRIVKEEGRPVITVNLQNG